MIINRSHRAIGYVNSEYLPELTVIIIDGKKGLCLFTQKESSLAGDKPNNAKGKQPEWGNKCLVGRV